MAMSKQEKSKRDQKRRQEKYIREVGPIPFCACGCGEKVNILAGNVPSKTVGSHRVKVDVINRKEFIDKVTYLRDKYNLSLGDLAIISEMYKGKISSLLFNKKLKYIQYDTAEKLLAPLVFIDIFLPNFDGSLFPKVSSSEGSRMRWESPKDHVEFEPIRQEMFKLKDELDTNWVRLGEYFGIDRTVLMHEFKDETHRWITVERARFFRKEFGKIRSLSERSKREIFARRPHNNHSYSDRNHLKMILRHYKDTAGLKNWKEVSEEIGIDYHKLVSTIFRSERRMRKSIYDSMVAKVHEANIKRDHRQLSIVGTIESDYGLRNGKRKRLRIKNEESIASYFETFS